MFCYTLGKFYKVRPSITVHKGEVVVGRLKIRFQVQYSATNFLHSVEKELRHIFQVEEIPEIIENCIATINYLPFPTQLSVSFCKLQYAPQNGGYRGTLS